MPSYLARPHIIKRNKPVGKKRHQPSKTAYNPKSPHQQVSEFQSENLTVSSGKLFCSGCKEERGLKATAIKLFCSGYREERGLKGTVQMHLKSKKHELGKKRLQAECVFSILSNSFTDTQESSLQDYHSCYSIMIHSLQCIIMVHDKEHF